MDGTYVLGVILVIIGGVSLAVQSGVNASLAKAAESRAFASVVSFALGLLACVLFFVIDSFAVQKQLPSANSIKNAPWWSWTGGVLGAFYVVVVIVFAHKLGAGTIVAIFVCAQLSTSIILDLIGLVGFSKRLFSWPRIVGAVLMIMGVVLITCFPGDTLAAVEKRLLLEQRSTAAGAAAVSTSGTCRGCSRPLMELGRHHAADVARMAAEAQVDATAAASPQLAADIVVKVRW